MKTSMQVFVCSLCVNIRKDVIFFGKPNALRGRRWTKKRVGVDKDEGGVDKDEGGCGQTVDKPLKMVDKKNISSLTCRNIGNCKALMQLICNCSVAA